MPDDHAELERLRSLASGLAGKAGLGEEETKALEIAATMTGVKRLPMKDITAKRGPLTADDRARMKDHAAAWAEFAGKLEPLKELGVARVLEAYTEHWDGTGHPAGLAGEEIPLAARVLCVCYHYVGMTSERAYRKALPHEHAVGELTRICGTVLDPKLVEMLLEMLSAEPEAVDGGGDLEAPATAGGQDDKPADKPADEPAGKPVDKRTEETAEETGAETAEETVEESTRPPVKEAARPPARAKQARKAKPGGKAVRKGKAGKAAVSRKSARQKRGRKKGGPRK